jgi:gliding motility-associated lipoprotein GldH
MITNLSKRYKLQSTRLPTACAKYEVPGMERDYQLPITNYRLPITHYRLLLVLLFTSIALVSCDSNRLYENNVDFKDRTWKITEPAQLEFDISDTTQRYNLYLDVRNSLDYPYARLFVNYNLVGPADEELSKKMISVYLFDQKTGKPHGRSGLGDIYDHQFIFLEKYAFPKPGKYKVKFGQFMRQDTLHGILAVGLRVEAVGK